MWYRTTRTRKEWEERGGMTIRTISRQHIGGATKKKDRAEWTNDGRLRQPRFLGLRDDKQPADVVRERPG